jgi:hypothetical protein
MLATKPGAVSDDVKTYLYIDPGRYVRQAISLWDPNAALGTVTHQNIGYLFPMGPFFWLCAELHLPVWTAQRLWMAALLFAAGAGVLYLARTIGLTGPGRYVATLAFMFTPYVLQYAGRISVILMPWAGLPWMLAFVILALRRPGWKYPALFALVILLVSGINASSIIYVVLGPALWLPYAVWVRKEATWGTVWAVVWRTALLTAGVCLWWVVGLQVEAAYGVNILKYSETIQSTSSGSSPVEVLRGLGYWFFYGSQPPTGNWTQAAVAYTQNLALIAATLLVPTLAFAAGAFVRWRNRAFFVLMLLVGTALAVGPFPYAKPTAVAALLKAFMQDTTAGLALRSTDRAGPLVILPLAVLLGAGVTALCRRVPRRAWLVTGVAVAVIAGASVPLWATGDTVVNGLTIPSPLPADVRQAATSLNATHPGTRVYAIPGNDFAAYRWGDSIDSVYPGILTRPFATHSQQPMGSLPTADLQEAFDTPLQEGTFDTRTLGPIASLMSAGDVLVQYDEQYERYGGPTPKQLARVLTPTPAGLGQPTTYGTPRPNLSILPSLDEQALAAPPNQPWPAPLASYPVTGTRPIVRTESTASPLVVAGNGAGVTAAASVGLLATNPSIFYSGTLDGDRSTRAAVLGGHPDLVVTDTNPKQGYRWVGITQNAGPIDTATSPDDQAYDPTNSPLDLFPKAPANAFSTTVFNGVTSITASSFGSPNQFDNDQRPAAAMDGTTSTAWQMGQLPTGQWWEVQLAKPHTMDSINLAQIITPRPTIDLKTITLTFDYTRPVTVNLTAASRTPAGQTIHFSPRTFSLLRITVDHAGPTKYNDVKVPYESFSGFSEVRLPGVNAEEAVSMPQDLLRTVGTSSIGDPLTYLMTRLRGSGYPPRGDSELHLARVFWLPAARTFNLTGQTRLSALASDQAVDQAVGRTGSGADPVTALSSSSRLAGTVANGAAAAIDGDPATAWQTAFGPTSQAGAYVQYQLASPLTVQNLDLQVLADGRHSVPTRITVSAGGQHETVALPSITDRHRADATVGVPVHLPQALTGSTVRVTVDTVRTETTTNTNTLTQDVLPIGVAELGIPGLVAPATPPTVPATCRNDLLAVDGNPVWVSVSGSTSAALARQPLSVSLCGPNAAGLHLAAGSHTLRSVDGSATGIDVDQLALASAPGGGPAAVNGAGQLDAPARAATPSVSVSNASDTAMTVHLSGLTRSTKPFELVLGQSINSGWQATSAGYSLGPAVLTDAFANGWRIDPAVLASGIHDGQLTVALRWTPQGGVDVALVISLLAVVACVVLVVMGSVRRRRTRDGASTPVSPDVHAASVAVVGSDGNGRVDGAGADDQDAAVPLGEEPELVASWRSRGHPLSWGRAVVVGLVGGLVAGTVAPPLTGVAVAAALVLVLRRPRWRLLLGGVAVGCMLLTLGYVLISQAVDPKPASGAWPSSFGTANAIIWVGLTFLAADALAELVLTPRSRAPGNASGDHRASAPHR